MVLGFNFINLMDYFLFYNIKYNLNANMIKKVLLLFIIGILIWSVGAKYISSHESIHYKIFQRHNITSSIDIDYLKLNGRTIKTNDNICNDTCKLENTINDVIGYNMSLLIYFLIVLFIINKSWKKIEEK